MREATLSSNGNFHAPATIYALGVPSSNTIFYCIAVVVTIAIFHSDKGCRMEIHPKNQE